MTTDLTQFRNMSIAIFQRDQTKSATLFAVGFFLVMLTLWVPFIPGWYTFIHMWRVELATSIFLLVALSYIAYKHGGRASMIYFSRDELKFIALPVLIFIAWSAISISWAPSWKSALHHTLVWTQYLIFYLIVRQIIDRGKDYRVMVTMLAITFVLFSFPAIIDYCLYLVFGGSTLVGVRSAKYGEQINAIAPLMIGGVLRLSGRQFLLGLLAVTSMWLLIFCSLGRINVFLFICAALGVGGVVFILKRFHRYRRKMLIVLGALIFALLPLHIFTFISEDANIPIVRRIGDEAGMSSSNNFRKLMSAISVEMFKTHPVIGIGADNFGMQVNGYRAHYGAQNPTDINLAAAENEIPERAHNEYLQIVAELGMVGGLIFLSFLSGVALMLFNALSRRTSLIPLAAIFGLGLFLVSSLVSSYSFRFIQNGFVFFFVLAVAAKFLLRPKERRVETISISAARMKFACAFGIMVCVLLAGYCIVRVSSVIYTTRANYAQKIEESIPLYETAMRLDNENPLPHFHLGYRLLQVGRFAESVPHFERSIEMGQGASPSFFHLSTAQILSGDKAAAEGTFEKAAKLYPLSPFVLTRYAFILQENGKTVQSAEQFERALEIDRGSAKTWWTIMNEGTQKASDNATRNTDLRPIMDLTPNDAIYAAIAERELRFPGEKKKPSF